MILFSLLVDCLTLVLGYQYVTDISKCKLSHLGLNYVGEIDKTEGGIRCQSWTAISPVHKIDNSIVDEMFPEKSKRDANNFCRNPNRQPDGPWCYSMSKELIYDTCHIPLCSFLDCRLTGPGMEYVGLHNRAVSDKLCLKWDKYRKKVLNITGKHYAQETFSKRRFPDETRGDAGKKCRNPDGDLGGPWCFVNIGNGEVEKQYCDIPFCDTEDCVTFTKKFNTYTHYTLFNNFISNLTFGIKRWNPDELESNGKILLSLFALPLTEYDIDKLQIGIEIYISNKHSAMTVGNKDKPEYESTLGIIKSSSFTFFTLVWNAGFVTLSLNGSSDPIFLAEYKWKHGLFKKHPNQFFYYSIQGTNVLWSLPFCVDECEVHTTTSNNFERFWPLKHANASYDLQMNVRAFYSATILFQPSPLVYFPNVKLIIGQRKDNITRLILKEHEKGPEIELKKAKFLHILNYWEWRKFIVTFFGNTAHLYWEKVIGGTQMVLDVKHDKLASMRWYSPGSDDSVASWSFFCSPGEMAAPPPPWPPECIINKDEIGYIGTQSVTKLGHPCLPWTYSSEAKSILGKNVSNYWNYCRDPFDEKKGTYCYAVNQKSKNKFTKEKCYLNLCQATDCRIAGTGNDYIGKTNITRSNRICQHWISNFPHAVNKTFLNNTVYAEQNISLAKNFCRNPSRNVAGPWCYTTDEDLPRDLCFVRDCVHNEECIILTSGSGEGRRIYILPEWKEGGLFGGLHFALKEWNPDFLDGLIFEITALDDKPGFIKLIIGADHNEKVIVYYGKSRKHAKKVKQKTLPHLIPVGAWAAFWLQMRRGEIMLGYEGTTDPLFVWEHDNKDKAFEPGYFTYMSIESHYVGVHFKCTECHTEKTFTQHLTRLMPIRLWNTTEDTDYSSLSIYARGNGILLIPLLLLPGEGMNYYAFAIGDKGTYIIFLLNMKNKSKTLAATRRHDVLKPDIWTHYYFTFSEYNIEVFKDNKTVLKYNSTEIMKFYWFTVTVESGWVTWAANCIPPDIDGTPREGGWSAWSPWECTVTCGGGTGLRYRTCTNPRPNIRGKLCKGPYTETGKCNEFPCGDITPKTMEKIRERMREKYFSFIITEGEKLEIENDKEMLDLVYTESPEASHQWTLNGIYLRAKQNEVDFVDYNIIIKSTNRLRHSGIYACLVYRIGGERVVIRVVSVAIVSKLPDITIRTSQQLTLVCNSVVLGYIYTDLSQLWLINNDIYIDYGIVTLDAVVTEQINYVNQSHSGNWTCEVTQKDLKFTWVINIIQIEVLKPPTWITHLMEDQFTRPIFGRLGSEMRVVQLFSIIIVLVIVLVAIGLILYLKIGTLPKRQYRRLINED